jgi:hypothetical protein
MQVSRQSHCPRAARDRHQDLVAKAAALYRCVALKPDLIQKVAAFTTFVI